MKSKTWSSGEPFVWICGGALALSILLVVGLCGLILVSGLGFFWPHAVTEVALRDGKTVLGQVAIREETNTTTPRIELKQGNRDISGADFLWIPLNEIAEESTPAWATVVERLEWGNAYGRLIGLRVESESHTGASLSEQRVQEALHSAHARREQLESLRRDKLGAINREQEALRLEQISSGQSDSKRAAELAAQYEQVEAEISAIQNQPDPQFVLQTTQGSEIVIPASQTSRIYRPNEMSVLSKMQLYMAKLWEFVSENPREANTEGGVFPAIFGTVFMVILMSIIATPLGVLAAVYLREYAHQGKLVALVRIGVSNLAGVPSIVFGVFGVGFFIYFVGASIDQAFFPEALPTPTFGTGGILWASLTLALLTLPIVIVTAEEGLAAIPRHLREASYALGATKFETLWRVILPSLVPSILTGVILAVARAAGEVAPLMITGVVKLAPALPLDTEFPFLHLDRKFMHLGFHIYDVGFQSPNVEAARPMVYCTTLLLLGIVIALNLTAVIVRNRLRKKFASSAV